MKTNSFTINEPIIPGVTLVVFKFSTRFFIRGYIRPTIEIRTIFVFFFRSCLYRATSCGLTVAHFGFKVDFDV